MASLTLVHRQDDPSSSSFKSRFRAAAPGCLHELGLLAAGGVEAALIFGAFVLAPEPTALTLVALVIWAVAARVVDNRRLKRGEDHSRNALVRAGRMIGFLLALPIIAVLEFVAAA